MKPRSLPVYFLALISIILGLSAAAGASDQTPASLKLIPALSGYPAGEAAPMLLLLELPAGARLDQDQTRAVSIISEADGPFAFAGLKAAALKERPGALILLTRLKVAPGAASGPAMVKGRVDLRLAGGRAARVDFRLPIQVLAAGEKPSMVSPQMLRKLGMPPPGGGGGATPEAPRAPADPFRGQSLGWILLMVFAAGLGLNFTPCVYPLIPITMSLFGGRSGRGKASQAVSALAYWAGIVAMYSALGATVALTGRILGQALTSPAVILGIAAVMLAMSASMFGLWEIRMPAALNRLAGANRAGAAGALLMGLLVGVLAAPCVGPFVVGLMTHVAQAGRVGYGLLLFLALSLGLGLPLTVLAFFSGSISRLPGAGDWMVWVRSFFGVILALMAVYMARPLLGDQLFLWLLALTGAAGGVYLGFIEKSGRGRFRVFKRAAGVVIIGLAGLCLWWFQPPAPNATGGHIPWRPVTQKALQEARAAGKPAVVFFTADWCPPCRQLKAVSLPDPRVIKAFEPFAHLKADLTTGGAPEVKRLTQLWRVRGVPTMVFLDGRGRAMPELTVVGFMPPSDLAERLKAVLGRSRAAGAGKGG